MAIVLEFGACGPNILYFCFVMLLGLFCFANKDICVIKHTVVEYVIVYMPRLLGPAPIGPVDLCMPTKNVRPRPANT